MPWPCSTWSRDGNSTPSGPPWTDRKTQSDLAAALGHIGNPGHPEVQAAIGQLFAAIKAQGKPIGILTPVEADARRYLEQGASFVAVGNDIGLFRA